MIPFLPELPAIPLVPPATGAPPLLAGEEGVGRDFAGLLDAALPLPAAVPPMNAAASVTVAAPLAAPEPDGAHPADASPKRQLALSPRLGPALAEPASPAPSSLPTGKSLPLQGALLPELVAPTQTESATEAAAQVPNAEAMRPAEPVLQPLAPAPEPLRQTGTASRRAPAAALSEDAREPVPSVTTDPLSTIATASPAAPDAPPEKPAPEPRRASFARVNPENSSALHAVAAPSPVVSSAGDAPEAEVLAFVAPEAGQGRPTEHEPAIRESGPKPQPPAPTAEPRVVLAVAPASQPVAMPVAHAPVPDPAPDRTMFPPLERAVTRAPRHLPVRPEGAPLHSNDPAVDDTESEGSEAVPPLPPLQPAMSPIPLAAYPTPAPADTTQAAPQGAAPVPVSPPTRTSAAAPLAIAPRPAPRVEPFAPAPLPMSAPVPVPVPVQEHAPVFASSEASPMPSPRTRSSPDALPAAAPLPDFALLPLAPAASTTATPTPAVADAALSSPQPAPVAPAMPPVTAQPALLSAALPIDPAVTAPLAERADMRGPSPSSQFASTIDQVGSLREALRAAQPAMTLHHAEFGAVSLKLESTGADGWQAVLASRDPAFVPAIQAALADRAAAPLPAPSAAPDTGSFAGQNGALPNGAGEQRSGSSPSGGQGTSQPYLGHSGSRDGEAAPDHRRPSTAAALAARTEAEDGGSAGPGPQGGGLFA